MFGTDILILSGIAALFGAALGSFAALVAERLLRGEPVLLARSKCQACGGRLGARDLVPLASYFFLRGKCRTCDAPIPSALVQAELAGAALMVIAVTVAPDPTRGGLLGLWMISLLALAITDLRAFRLPDPLVLLSAALGLALALAGDGSGWPTLWDRALNAGVGALAGGGSFWAIRIGYWFWAGREGMGLGDVKLMAALGLALGLALLPITVLVAALAALGLAILRARRRGRALQRLGSVPFGAALALAGAFVKAAAMVLGV